MDLFSKGITELARRFNRKAAMTGAVLMAALSVCTVSVRAEENVKVNLPSAGITYALSASKTSVKDIEDKLYQEGVITEKKVKVANSIKTSVISAVSKEGAEQVSAIMETALTPIQEKEKALAGSAMEKAENVVSAAASAVTVISSTQQAREEAMAAAAKALQKAQEAARASVAVDYAPDSETVAEVSAEASEAVSGTDAQDDQDIAEERTAEEPSEQMAESAEGAGEESEQVSDENGNEASEAEEAQPDQNLVVAQVSSYINVRKEPGINAEIVGKLYSNGVGMILEAANSDGWMKIQSGDVIGYVKMDYVATGTEAAAIADEVSHKQAVITTTTLRVRAAATTESDVITLIGMGAELDIIGEEDGWYKVNTQDGEGYISADFADLEVIYPVAESREEEERKAAAKRAEQAQQSAQSSQGSSASGSSQNQQKAAGSGSAPAVAAGTAKGQEVANYAMQFIGNPYVWGGTSLTNGADCSGFTMAVYSHFGVSLPHYDAAQRQCGIAVNSLAEAVPGDLICYYGHVGIYIGNGQIVHASSPRYGIITGSATYRQISAIRRIFY